MHISIIISYSISVPFEHQMEYDIDGGSIDIYESGSTRLHNKK